METKKQRHDKVILQFLNVESHGPCLQSSSHLEAPLLGEEKQSLAACRASLNVLSDHHVLAASLASYYLEQIGTFSILFLTFSIVLSTDIVIGFSVVRAIIRELIRAFQEEATTLWSIMRLVVDPYSCSFVDVVHFPGLQQKSEKNTIKGSKHIHKQSVATSFMKLASCFQLWK